MEQALARELMEEAGIDAANCEIKLVDDKGTGQAVRERGGEQVSVDMHFFVFEVKIDAFAADVRLSASDDLMNLRWFSRGALSKVKLNPPSISLFKRLGYL